MPVTRKQHVIIEQASDQPQQHEDQLTNYDVSRPAVVSLKQPENVRTNSAPAVVAADVTNMATEQVQCPVCYESFAIGEDLTRHILNVHPLDASSKQLPSSDDVTRKIEQLNPAQVRILIAEKNVFVF